MTKNQIDSVKELKIGNRIVIGRVTIKRDRGQYNVSHGKFIGTYKDNELGLMIEKVDELNTEVIEVTNQPFEIEGTDWVGYKNSTGLDIYHAGKIIYKSLSERDFQIYVAHRQKELRNIESEKVKKSISKEYKSAKQRKSLYYFILFLSAVILIAVYVLGIKFDGVTIRRENEALYDTITYIANEKYPGKRSDKYDAVYYTLNYYAHADNYLMTTKTLEDGTEVSVNSLLRKQYEDKDLSMDLTNDHSYSGYDFNMMFRAHNEKYVSKDLVYKYLGWVMGEDGINNVKDLAALYERWDENDNKVNRAYEWDIINEDGSSAFDTRATYYQTYLRRNGFLRLFVNDTSKFIHEYILFESLGWLNWASFAVLVLYILLALSVWIFKKDNLKTSKHLIRIIMILSLVMIVPLTLQYFSEGLSKAPSEFLDVVENTRFTTTTTIMNFVFSYLMKFSNIILTGILVIALPLKVIRYFVLNAVSKLDKEGRIVRAVSPDTIISEKISKSDYRL